VSKQECHLSSTQHCSRPTGTELTKYSASGKIPIKKAPVALDWLGLFPSHRVKTRTFLDKIIEIYPKLDNQSRIILILEKQKTLFPTLSLGKGFENTVAARGGNLRSGETVTGDGRSDRVPASFAGPYPDDIFNGQNKNLSVTNFFRVGGSPDGIDHPINLVSIHHQFNFQFRIEIDIVFRTAVHFFMAFLPAVAFHLRDGHSGNTDFGQGLFHSVKLERLDDCLNFLHEFSPLLNLSALEKAHFTPDLHLGRGQWTFGLSQKRATRPGQAAPAHI
jgi:hypothetical protein